MIPRLLFFVKMIFIRPFRLFYWLKQIRQLLLKDYCDYDLIDLDKHILYNMRNQIEAFLKKDYGHPAHMTMKQYKTALNNFVKSIDKYLEAGSERNWKNVVYYFKRYGFWLWY